MVEYVIMWERNGKEHKYIEDSKEKALFFAKTLKEFKNNKNIRVFEVKDNNYKLIKSYN